MKITSTVISGVDDARNKASFQATPYATRVTHAPGMPGTFSPPPRVSDSDMHHNTWVTHVSWCRQGSLTSGFRWSRKRGKRSRHSRRMHNPQFCISGKRPLLICLSKKHSWKLTIMRCCGWHFILGRCKRHFFYFKCNKASQWGMYFWDSLHTFLIFRQ